MAIKKSYTDIVNFLQANENKKVSTILNDILAMCESKKQSTTFIKDSDGNVVAIYCYYHKQWEIVKDVPYGSKANSTTGLNTMCKVGTSLWTKKQRIAKATTASLLDDLMAKKIESCDIQSHRDAIELERTTIDETNMPTGFVNEVDVKIALEL